MNEGSLASTSVSVVWYQTNTDAIVMARLLEGRHDSSFLREQPEQVWMVLSDDSSSTL